MSATSTKIFGNDMAMDVKDDFRLLWGIGKSVDEIQDYIFRYQPDDDDEEACAFWSGLALVEWEYGILTDFVKRKAKYVILNHSDESLFLSEKQRQSRKEELQGLLEKISSKNPAPKKIKKPFIYRTEWKEGDIFAIPLEGKYVYFHVCAVLREKQKIKELEQDEVYIRVFDIVSEEVLSLERFKKRLFSRIKYKGLDQYRECYVKMLWCMGIREKTALENKIIHIGNIPTKTESTKSVSANFQFSKIEDTLKQLFGLK